MARKVGSPLSAAEYAQKQSACLTRRRKRVDPDTGKVVVFNDRGTLRKLDVLCDGDKDLECLFKSYVGDILSNPLMFLAKEIAELKVRIRKQEQLDVSRGDECHLSPLVLKADELCLKAAKLYGDGLGRLSSSGKGRRVDRSVHDDLVVDAEYFEEVKE